MTMKKNLVFAFIAQIISLILSVFMTLIVSKILTIEQYSYWQLFLFYAGYVSLGLIGINDGIYLRFGGTAYEDLNYKLIAAQYKLIILLEIILTIIIACISFFINNPDRSFIVLMIAIHLFFNNITGFLSSILQAVNKTYQFSISVIIEKIISFLPILFLTITGNISYQLIIIIYIISKLFSLVYSIKHTRNFSLLNVRIKFKDLKELIMNMKVGMILSVSTFAGSLIIGIARIFIDNVWGVTEFGKISFSLLLTNFFLQFINQISMVLFPALRSITIEKQLGMYKKIRPILSWILTAILILYFPAYNILGIWMPKYIDSLNYLSITLLICIFDGKMQMLLGTYMKVLRKEKTLMLINCATVFISFIICGLGAYFLHNFIFVLVGMTISIALRSTITELYVNKLLSVNYKKYIIVEIILSITFIISSSLIKNIVGFFVYIIFYIVYIFLCKEDIKLIKMEGI